MLYTHTAQPYHPYSSIQGGHTNAFGLDRLKCGDVEIVGIIKSIKYQITYLNKLLFLSVSLRVMVSGYSIFK